MFLCLIAYLLKSLVKNLTIVPYRYFADSVHWRYIIDRFVIDVYLKTIVAKKRNAHISLKCNIVFMPLRTMQLLNLFFTKCSTYYAFCEANLPYDKVEERKAFSSSCNGANPF